MTSRILVVDDDTALAEMIGIVLRTEGFDTAFCADGAKAVDAWRTERPDLILLDLMLVALASKPQQVFSREMLLEQVWGYHYKADTRLVNVHVQRLRAKVELDPDNPKIVTTVRGVGYRAGAVV